MGKIPETRKNIESDPDLPSDADSDDPRAIVENLTDEQLDEAWDAEVDSWARLQIHPAASIGIDAFLLKSKFEIVLEILIEAGMIVEEEFEKRLKRHMLTQMIELRREHQSNLMRAKLTEGIQNPEAPKPGMFLPPGIKI